MFSLCIATMNRYDQFLKQNLPKYLENPYLKEIIITDENGQDAKKIQENFSNDKLKVYTNEVRLGPFLNKFKALKMSTTEWVCLMDSDNFADQKFFETVKTFIEHKNLKEDCVFMPSFAKPQFNYKHLPETFSLNGKGNKWAVCFNTGNYVLHRNLFEQLNLEGEDGLIQHSSACDVIYFNTLLLEQFPSLSIFVLQDLEYQHAVHQGSIYVQTAQKEKKYNEIVHQRFYSLFWDTIPSNLFYCGNKDTYPPFKNGDYLEEYFLNWYKSNGLQGKGKRKYIPALWTNFQIEQWFPKRKKEMQMILNQWVKNYPSPNGYFTVVQYDDAVLLQLPPNTKVFGACSGDIPIPLIYEDKNKTLEGQTRKSFDEKEIFCSFVGSMTSNNFQPNVRMVMKNTFEQNPKFHLNIGKGWTSKVNKGNQDNFIETTLNSKFALAPRGYGRSSFRFFEILQLGTIPIYIWNDKNWLPFQDAISYSKLCIVLHVSQMGVLEEKLASVTKEKYESMLEYYETIKHYFTLEGMSQEINRIVELPQ